MLTDIQRAMLGDHEAAKRLTEAGVLIPCRCGATPTLLGDKFNTGGAEGRRTAILEWNIRAPILSESELKKLCGGGEED